MVSLSLVRFPIVGDAVGGWRELTLSDTLQGLFWSHFTLKREGSLRTGNKPRIHAAKPPQLANFSKKKEIPSCAK